MIVPYAKHIPLQELGDRIHLTIETGRDVSSPSHDRFGKQNALRGRKRDGAQRFQERTRSDTTGNRWKDSAATGKPEAWREGRGLITVRTSREHWAQTGGSRRV